jgi:hypothetical protein|tara:strand:- start:28 stop:654 length:627 start_codon:yes stop_codon:yes gene_type:complete
MVKVDNNNMRRAFQGGDVPSKNFPDQNLTGLGDSAADADIKKLESVMDLGITKDNNLNLASSQGGNNMIKNTPRNIPMAAVRTGGAYIRKAAEGNVALPMGGMPPPPSSEESVSPEMAEEAKSLGIEVAPPGATAEEVADDQLVLLSEGELVVPANVVRYHGLAQYEKMRKAALNGLDEMDKEGQLVSPQDNAPEGLLGPNMPEGAPV